MSSPVTPQAAKALISDPTASMCGNFINTLLRLPVLFYSLVNFLFDSDGNFTTEITKMLTDLTLRPGDYIFSGAPVDEVGRLLCNGQEVSRETYADLYAKISTIYGTGNGTTTFNVPDFTDRFPKGKGGEAVGTEGGNADNEVTLAIDNVPPHAHNLGISGSSDVTSPEVTGVLYATGDPDLLYVSANTSPNVATTQNAGGSGSPAAAQPLNVQNLYLSCYIFIKT